MVRLVDAEASADGLLALYDEQVGAVYAFVLRRCGEVELAEDLTQETFVEAARRFRDTAEIAAPSWLFSVARNRLIDHWRREARMRRKVPQCEAWFHCVAPRLYLPVGQGSRVMI